MVDRNSTAQPQLGSPHRTTLPRRTLNRLLAVWSSWSPWVRRVILLCSLLFVFTAGYRLIEGWPWFQCLWYTATIVSTVGLGTPLAAQRSAAGDYFTLAVMLVGVGAVGVIVRDILGQLVAARTLEDKRMKRILEYLSDHYVICGFGRLGRVIARLLHERHAEFVVVDHDPAVAEELSRLGYLHLIGDVREDDVLRQAGVERARGLLACIEPDSDNVFVVLSARDMNPNLLILARSSTPALTPKLQRVGVDVAIEMFEAVGQRFVQALLHPILSRFLEQSLRTSNPHLQMEEIPVSESSSLVGQALRDAPIRGELNVILVAIQHATGEMTFNPASTTVISAHDILVAIGERGNLDRLAAMAG
jgi:voltage-gated potassium channel